LRHDGDTAAPEAATGFAACYLGFDRQDMEEAW
jgi:hypothetical protein